MTKVKGNQDQTNSKTMINLRETITGRQGVCHQTKEGIPNQNLNLKLSENPNQLKMKPIWRIKNITPLKTHMKSNPNQKIQIKKVQNKIEYKS